jgi:hypothetical protein
MNIELSSTELALLRQILETRLGDYSMQIADADQSDFKARLRGEREELAGIIAKLKA